MAEKTIFNEHFFLFFYGKISKKKILDFLDAQPAKQKYFLRTLC